VGCGRQTVDTHWAGVRRRQTTACPVTHTPAEQDTERWLNWRSRGPETTRRRAHVRWPAEGRSCRPWLHSQCLYCHAEGSHQPRRRLYRTRDSGGRSYGPKRLGRVVAGRPTGAPRCSALWW